MVRARRVIQAQTKREKQIWDDGYAMGKKAGVQIGRDQLREEFRKLMDVPRYDPLDAETWP